jgi:hypothetical protein
MEFFLNGIIASIVACITGRIDDMGDNHLTMQHISSNEREFSDDNSLTIRHINYDAEYITYGANNEPQKSIQLHELEHKFMPSLRDYCIKCPPPNGFYSSSYDDEPLNTFERLAAFHWHLWLHAKYLHHRYTLLITGLIITN